MCGVVLWYCKLYKVFTSVWCETATISSSHCLHGPLTTNIPSTHFQKWKWQQEGKQTLPLWKIHSKSWSYRKEVVDDLVNEYRNWGSVATRSLNKVCIGNIWSRSQVHHHHHHANHWTKILSNALHLHPIQGFFLTTASMLSIEPFCFISINPSSCAPK